MPKTSNRPAKPAKNTATPPVNTPDSEKEKQLKNITTDAEQFAAFTDALSKGIAAGSRDKVTVSVEANGKIVKFKVIPTLELIEVLRQNG